jgi:cobalamin biosynthesis protein CobT
MRSLQRTLSKRKIMTSTFKYEIRCSPNCPFDDCVILTDIPPLGGEGDPDEQDNREVESQPRNDSSKDSEATAERNSSAGETGQSDSGQNDRTSGAMHGDDGDNRRRDTADKGDPKRSSKSDTERPDRPERSVDKSEKASIEYKPVFLAPKEFAGHGYGGMDETLPDDLVKSTVKVDLTDKVFKQRLKNIMHDNAYDRRVRGRKRGKLDMRSLYKVPAKQDNVFTLKQARKNKEYNVMLVVDESGSMNDGKSEIAADCTVFLAKAFAGIHVNTAVIGFNQFISIRKHWEADIDYNTLHESIRTMNHNRGIAYNCDWDALNMAYQMFKKAPKGNNVLVMLSDGAPVNNKPTFIDATQTSPIELAAPKNTNSLDYEDKESRHHLHALVRSNRNVDSIGIGILEGGWQVPNHIVVKSVNQLKPMLIKELRQRIRRG